MIRKRYSTRGAEVFYLSNLDEVLRDLKKIDPEARKSFTKETTKILTPYVDIARGFIPTESPLSGWRTVEPTYTSPLWANDLDHRGRDAAIRWKWDSGDAKRNIRIKRGYQKGSNLSFDNVVGIENASVSGKMFELIGQGKKKRDSRNKARNTKAGTVMRNAMNAKHGNRKRGVWRIKEEYGDGIGFRMSRMMEPIIARFERGR
jgi:hypothetical protein